VIKNGIPTVIAGKPNAGKSTLLNALLNEERALVSPLPGTTRDVIEDELVLGGVAFRFMDTAGLRDTTDIVEAMGVARTRERMDKAALILYVFDLTQRTREDIRMEEAEIEKLPVPVLKIGNKIDQADAALLNDLHGDGFVLISAARRENLAQLKENILARFQIKAVRQGDVVVTNLRHYQSLTETDAALTRVLAGLDQDITGDFLAMDIRQALHHLGLITGAVTTDDLLANIFAKFCIGK